MATLNVKRRNRVRNGRLFERGGLEKACGSESDDIIDNVHSQFTHPAVSRVIKKFELMPASRTYRSRALIRGRWIRMLSYHGFRPTVYLT